MEQERPPEDIRRQYLAAKRGGVYVGPGLEEGCFVVPASAVVALVSAIVVAVASGDAIIGLVAGLGGLVAGVLAWLALWELFVRLHPRFSSGTGNAVKYVVVVLGPLVVVCAAAVGIARS
jgi:hypothetical protein